MLSRKLHYLNLNLIKIVAHTYDIQVSSKIVQLIFFFKQKMKLQKIHK